jgi:hypothetical protein
MPARQSTALISRRKENSEHDDHRQYSEVVTYRESGHLTEYGYRWEIESGYRPIKRVVVATREGLDTLV